MSTKDLQFEMDKVDDSNHNMRDDCYFEKTQTIIQIKRRIRYRRIFSSLLCRYNSRNKNTQTTTKIESLECHKGNFMRKKR